MVKAHVGVCVFYGILAGSVIWFLTTDGVILTPDSINYLSMANAIQKGLWTETLIATWPPFFPALIALINSFGFYGEQSARIVSIISYSILVGSMFLLTEKIGGKLAAHLTSFSLLFLAPLLFVYAFCWSETVYITLSALTLLILWGLNPDVKEGAFLRLGLAGLVAGLAILTRYMGVSLLIAGLIIVLLFDKRRRVLDKIRGLMSFGVIACIPILLYLVACSHYRGILPGYGHHTLPSLWQNLVSFIRTAYNDLLTLNLSLSNKTLFPHNDSWTFGMPIKLLGSLAGLLFIVVIVFFILIRQRKTTIKKAAMPVIYVISYSLSFVIIISYKVPISIATRFCAPIYPFMVLLFFLVIVGMCRAYSRKKGRFLVFIVSIIAVLCFWSIQAISSSNVWRNRKPTEKIPPVTSLDITGDNMFDVSDLIFLCNYLFKSGPQPRPLQNANLNCDATVNISDVIYLVNYLYRNGPPPCNLQEHGEE